MIVLVMVDKFLNTNTTFFLESILYLHLGCNGASASGCPLLILVFLPPSATTHQPVGFIRVVRGKYCQAQGQGIFGFLIDLCWHWSSSLPQPQHTNLLDLSEWCEGNTVKLELRTYSGSSLPQLQHTNLLDLSEWRKVNTVKL